MNYYMRGYFNESFFTALIQAEVIQAGLAKASPLIQTLGFKVKRTLLFITNIFCIVLMISFTLKADEIKSDSGFPDDENGRVLLQMKERGDDLSKPRKIDFVVVFPNHSSAELFASHFKKLGYEIIINNSKTIDTHPWDVIIQKNMIPTHRDITAFEDELGEYAATMSGRNDGWGGFVQQQ